MAEFGKKLQAGTLDRSCIRGETYCLEADPAVGYSIWEAENRREFDAKFKPWKDYYEETDVREVIAPQQAMQKLVRMK
jgi:hypothetical protein